MSTVARVLKGDLGLVGAQTAARVREQAQQLGYYPSAAARALAAGRTNAVAVAYQYPNLAHHSPVISAACEVAQRYGFRLVHAPVDAGGDPSVLIKERHVDALVLAGVPGAYEAPEWTAEDQIVVTADAARWPDPPPVPFAFWDDREGFEQALEHLKGLGHCSVAFLAGVDPYKAGLFEAEAERLGLQGRVITHPNADYALMMHSGADMAREALKLRPRPTALFARNDDIAIGALHALNEDGVVIPDEMSVIGYFDLPVAGFCCPSLSSIATPFAECVASVMTVALEALRDERVVDLEPTATRFPTRLVARKSTGPAGSEY